MTDQQPVGDPDSDRRTLLFVTHQPLLAETLAYLFASDSSWDVRVLTDDHPDLPSACRALNPSVVVVDVDSDVVPGLTLLGNIRLAVPQAGVVVIGDSSPGLVEAIGFGAHAYLTYDASIEALRDAVDAARAGRTTIDALELGALLGDLRRVQPDEPARPPLSSREAEILRRLAAGESTESIADALGIRVATARKHIQNILKKLGVHSKLQAAAYAVKAGLV